MSETDSGGLLLGSLVILMLGWGAPDVAVGRRRAGPVGTPVERPGAPVGLAWRPPDSWRRVTEQRGLPGECASSGNQRACGAEREPVGAVAV